MHRQARPGEVLVFLAIDSQGTRGERVEHRVLEDAEHRRPRAEPPVVAEPRAHDDQEVELVERPGVRCHVGPTDQQHEQHRRGGEGHVGGAAEPLHPAVRHPEREPGQQHRVREAGRQERGQSGPARRWGQADHQRAQSRHQEHPHTGDPALPGHAGAEDHLVGLRSELPEERGDRVLEPGRGGERHRARDCRVRRAGLRAEEASLRSAIPGSRRAPERLVTLTPQRTAPRDHHYTLKRKCMQSPSWTTYSLPSIRSRPFSRTAASLPSGSGPPSRTPRP